MARPRVADVIKIRRGTLQQHAGRARDEIPVKGKLEAPPPFMVLDADEQRVFDWLLKEGAIRNVHGAIDSLIVAHAAKVQVRLDRCLQKVAAHGEIMKVRNGVNVQPYGKLARVLTDQLRGLLSESGMTLQGRLKNAPPAGTLGASTIPTWDDIDS